MSSPSHLKDGAKIQAKHLTLPEAIYSVVHESGMPPKEIADRVGKSAAYLYAAADPNNEHAHLQVGTVAPLTNATGNPAILHSLARSCGGVFVKLHAGEVAPDADTARVLSEVAEYLQRVAASSADGKVTRTEFEQTRHEIRDAIEALLAHEHSLERRVVEDEHPAPRAVAR